MFGKKSKKEIREKFSGCVSDEFIEKVLSGQMDEELTKLKSMEIDFVFIYVSGDTAEKISRNIGIVTDIAVSLGALADTMVSGLILVTYGLFESDKTEYSRINLVKVLLDKLGKQVKIIHGSKFGHYGNLGGPSRFSYSFIIPDFLNLLKKLDDTSFGEAVEVK